MSERMGSLQPVSFPLHLTTESPEGTQAVGQALGKLAQPGDIFLLSGDLGAGKTCLTQGIAWGAGFEDYARSPTFVLATCYQGRLPVYHIDLYRLDNLEEVLDLGLDEYLFGEGICVVEWADKAPEAFPSSYLSVHLEECGDTQRTISFTPQGPRPCDLLIYLKQSLTL